MPGVPLYWVTLANSAGIGAIVAVGLVVLTGVGGMTSFAQATFVGFGAYATALLTTRLGWSPWLALPASLAVSALAAVLIGAITLRLSGHYLALGTIAWAVSFYYLFGNSDLVNRNDGISGIPPVSVLGHALLDGRAYFVVVWLAVALALLLSRNLLDSRVGRSLRALRGGSAAAASCGVHLARARLLAFTWAATLAGLAGWLYAHMQRSVNPTPFGLNASIEYLLMAVLGGLAFLPGAVLGAALFVLVNDWLQDLLPRLLGGLGGFETVVFGALLVLLLQVAPEGLWPHVAPPAAPPPGAVPSCGRSSPARPRPALARHAAPRSGRNAQAVRRPRRGGRCLAPRGRRRDRGPHRPERRRQEHPLQPAHGRRPADRRGDPLRGPRHRRPLRRPGSRRSASRAASST